MADFVLQISEWYRQNKRDLPWRTSKNPYFIWLSEVILQQTRVDQGMPYYRKFVSEYPEVSDLAAADEDAVLKLWQGLGYYSRARNLHRTAQQVVEVYHGVFPSTYDELLQLKGIGPYTAAAIASIAFNEAKAVVDGNVYRVLSRYFGIDTPIDTTPGKKEFQQLADTLLPADEAGHFNQAIMEFGALFCVPNNPDCQSCPVGDSCASLAAGKVSERPVKQGKAKVRKRYLHYFHLEKGEEIALQQRLGKDVWFKLYEFPLIESDSEDLPETAVNLVSEPQLIYQTKHVLSHQHIYASFYCGKPNTDTDLQFVPKADFHTFPIHRLMEKYWELHEKKEAGKKGRTANK